MGDLLFSRRLGFSGTPSNLLPVELGKCEHMKGDDAKMLHYLTAPSIVGTTRLPVGWDVLSVLREVATTRPPLHALIDTGAVVTGYSNCEVATLLLEMGLPHVRGVVFLDEHDRKMILLREGLQIMKLEQCGIEPAARFSFYDQVHTTGMDIPQPLAACAALTLGKDMSWRDYAQGAFRMRGLGAGQRIELLMTPEVERLVDDAILKCA